ncbi:sushi domain-containing protein 2-like [Saccostrea echinata]|uniref:sushi domain-containing protein 2-like n=1 Tax=Saccostrea echinata TaxID=191078 RepID=UPI002A82D060|nr:sushi domain-containing protein 2-like [Saccostrea echinata]
MFYPLLMSWTVCAVRVETLSVSDFYPFGGDNGDTVMAKNDDGNSPDIPVSTKFPFFDKPHNKLIVSTNGAISFLTPVSQYTPDPFPLDGDRRLITPYWGDVDTRKGGQVWYRETTNSRILDRASNEIKTNFPEFNRFHAAWVFIATWDKVAFYGCSNGGCSKRNTFQAVLITNGQHAFAIFNYANIQWTTGTASEGNANTGLGGKPAQVGFNAGDGKVYYVVNGSRTADIVNINSKSNVDIPGKFVFRIDSSKIGGGGCNTEGNVIITPRSGPMFGGQHLTFSGPCVDQYSSFKVKFPGIRWVLECEIKSQYSFVCITPMFDSDGDLSVLIYLSNRTTTHSFEGTFFVLNPAFSKVLVNRVNPDIWGNGEHSISWDEKEAELENSSSVDLHLFTLQLRNGGLKFESFIAKKNISKSECMTTFSLNVTQHVALLRVTSRVETMIKMPPRGIWSDVFPISKSKDEAIQACQSWIKSETKSLSTDFDVGPCPCTIQQAVLDIVKYQPDPDCNRFQIKSKQTVNCRYRRDARHCVRLSGPSETGMDNVCCFNAKGNLIDSRVQEGGTLQRFHYLGKKPENVPYITNFYHDVVPFLQCCRFSQMQSDINQENTTYNLCQDFLKIRKYSSCQNYEPPRPARTSGDPHLSTLDGYSYTFNGAGEFVYIYTEDDLFKSQIRFEQFQKEDGSLVQATVATALVMEHINSSDRIEVRLNPIRTADVLRNGQLLDFEESNWMNLKGVTVILLPVEDNSTDKSIMVMFKDIKIAFNIQASKKILNISPVVQGDQLKGKLKGLLGNSDGNASNDLLSSTQQQLPENATDVLIFNQFGMSWVINETESLFTYEPGKSFADYHQPSFRPVFESSVTVTEEVRAVCGEDKECIFDFSVTGSRDVAEQSLTFQKQFQESQEAALIVLTCSDLPTIPGGVWESTNGNLENSSAVFVCRNGYMVYRSTNNVTCRNGHWEPNENPSCIKYGTDLYTRNTSTPIYSTSSDLPVYIGVGVGILFIIIFILILVILIRKRQRSGGFNIFSRASNLTPTEDTDDRSTELSPLKTEKIVPSESPSKIV